MWFTLYGREAFKGLELDELLAEAKTHGLMARAENSGSEACYVEVARWNYDLDEWQRYAFEKFFGGELAEFPDDNCFKTCDRVAAQINAASACGRNNYQSFIHSFKNFTPPLTHACPECKTVFPRTDCNTRRANEPGMMPEEQRIFIECPKCGEEFEKS